MFWNWPGNWPQRPRTKTLELSPGDGLLLFTDGVNEAMTAKHEEFDFPRIKEYADASAGADAQTFVEGLVAAIKQFAAGAEQSDDISIVYAKRKG